MDTEELLNKYLPLVKTHWMPLAFGGIGLIFLVYGLIALFGSTKQTEEIIFEQDEAEKVSVKTQENKIAVDIEGGVMKPGVYYLPSFSRIQDVLIAAGGLASDADREWVSKNLNLASKLSDGAKIYIHRVGEAVTSTETVLGGIVGGLVNINIATASELDKLPGIGAVTVQKIIDGRPYSSVEDLLLKKIVGSKVFEQIKEKVTAY